LIIREKRYFRIKNGVLYWYLNERSRESQNKINFIDIDEILMHSKPEKKTKFLIVFFFFVNEKLIKFYLNKRN